MSNSNDGEEIDAFDILSNRIDSIQVELSGKVERLTLMFEEFIRNSSTNTKSSANTKGSPTSSDSLMDNINNDNNTDNINKTPYNVKNLRFKSKNSAATKRQSISLKKLEENEEKISSQDQFISRSIKIPDCDIPTITNFMSISYILSMLDKAERYEELYKVSSNLGQKIERNLCDSIPALLKNTTCNGFIDNIHMTGTKIFGASLSTIYSIFQYILEPRDKHDFLIKFKKGLENKSIEFPKNSLVTPLNYVNKLYPQVLGYLKQVQSLLDFLITDTLSYDILPALDKPSPSKIPGNPDNLLYLIFSKVPDNLFINVYYNENMSNIKFHKIVDGVVVVDPEDYKDFFKQFLIPFNKYLEICTNMNTFNRMFTGSSHDEKKKNVLKIGINNYSKLSNLLDGNTVLDDTEIDDLEERAQVLSYVIESLEDKYNLSDTRDAYNYISNINAKGSSILPKDLSNIPCYNVVRGKSCEKHAKGLCKFGGHDGKMNDLVLSKRKEEFNLYKQLLNSAPASLTIKTNPTSREAINAKDDNINYRKLSNLLVNPDVVDTDMDYIAMIESEVQTFLGSLDIPVDVVRIDLLKRIIVKCSTIIDGVSFEFKLLIDTGNFSYPIIYKSALMELIKDKVNIPFKTSIFSHGLPDGTGLSTDQSLLVNAIVQHNNVVYKGSINFQVFDDISKPIKAPFNAIVGLGSFLYGGSELRKFSSTLLRDLADYIDTNSDKLSYIEYIDSDTGSLQYITNAMSLCSIVDSIYLPDGDSQHDRIVYEADDPIVEVVNDDSVVQQDSSNTTSN